MKRRGTRVVERGEKKQKKEAREEKRWGGAPSQEKLLRNPQTQLIVATETATLLENRGEAPCWICEAAATGHLCSHCPASPSCLQPQLYIQHVPFKAKNKSMPRTIAGDDGFILHWS